MRHKRRLLRLVQPRLQIRLMLAFGGVAATGLLLQYLLFTLVLTRAGLLLLDQLGGVLLTILVGSFLVLLPLVGLVGVLATRRWAGPLFRFERFLRELDEGRRPDDIRLRDGDELTGFADLLNRVTAPLRREQAGDDSHAGGQRAA
jgi:signal transduction histidine kinase